MNQVDLKGGSSRQIPPYKNPKNDPGIPNKQKEIFAANMAEKNRQHGTQQKNTQKDCNSLNNLYEPVPNKSQPIMNLQLYKPIEEPVKNKINPTIYMPHVNEGPYYPPQWANYVNGMPLPPGYGLSNPILKEYKINISGPTADHVRVNNIYEDVLPNRLLSLSSMTLSERLDMYHVIRNRFVKYGDGEDISLGGGDNSLMSYLKLIELNPFNSNQFTNNPYKGLADNFLIYRSCYPIKLDRNQNNIQCAKNNTGMMLRIYRLLESEYYTGSDPKIYIKHDVWREVYYYDFIKENIIKNKICPHFPIMYTYYVSKNADIDFDKLMQIKYKTCETNVTNPPFRAMLPSLNQTGGNTRTTNINMVQKMLAKKNPFNTNVYKNKAIVILTEAPTLDFIGWCSKTYTVEGTIKSMINDGYHKSHVWKSIIFQILAALYTMQINNICINEFNLKDNIYIKDVKAYENTNNHWKYIINDIEYYIPNYGYVVYIDTNYRDIEDLTKNKNSPKKHKILGKIFGDNELDINIEIIKAVKNVTDPNNFSASFVNLGGVKPPDDILRLLTKIHNKALHILKNIPPSIKNTGVKGRVPPGAPPAPGPAGAAPPVAPPALGPAGAPPVAPPAPGPIGAPVAPPVAPPAGPVGAPPAAPGGPVGAPPAPGGPVGAAPGSIPSRTNRKVNLPRNVTLFVDEIVKQNMSCFMNNRIGTLLKINEINNIRKDDISYFKRGECLVHEFDNNLFKFVLFESVNMTSRAGINRDANVFTRSNPTDKDIIYAKVPLDTLYRYSDYEQIQQEFNGKILSSDKLLETYVINS